MTINLEERLTFDTGWFPSTGFFLVNRFQILYYSLFFPELLGYPYMVWTIPIAALLSHVNLWILCRWLKTEEGRHGYAGFVQLFGSGGVRLFAFLGIGLLLLNCSIVTLGYVEVVHEILFPSINQQSLLILLCLVSFYLASHGLSATGRFGLIAFLGTIWVVLLYLQIFSEPEADWAYLFPLVSPNMLQDGPERLLVMWAAFSGPEYLAFAGKRFISTDRLFKWFALGNLFTAVEYLILFLASILFFGEEYLRKVDQPVVNMISYIRLPFFERLEMIIISGVMISYVIWVSFFMLYVYEAMRIAANRVQKPKSVMGVLAAAALVTLFAYAFDGLFWGTETGSSRWKTVYIWLSGCTYAAIPSFLLLSVYVKSRRGRREA